MTSSMNLSFSRTDLMTLVIGKDHVLGGWWSNIEVTRRDRLVAGENFGWSLGRSHPGRVEGTSDPGPGTGPFDLLTGAGRRT